MNSNRRKFRATLFAALVVFTTLSAAAQEMFPMARGTTWVYLARVKWGGEGTETGGTSTLRWTVSISDSFHKGDIAAARLHGGPWDLAWYEPGMQPADHLVVRISDTYYLLHDEVAPTLADIKAGKTADLDERLADDIWFRIPMQVSDSFCAPQEQERSPFNCWSVEKVTTTRALRIPGFRSPPTQTEYFLAFLANPDTETLTLVPGAGIVTWNYEHHGTVAEASLKLIEFRAPGARPAAVPRRPRASKPVR